MGNSTKSVASFFDVSAGKGIPDPRQNAAGYGATLALQIANDVMGDIIAERFNWKWNRANGAAFYTNSWQQDYPQPAQAAGPIGWLEGADRIDINNTSIPKPIKQMTVVRGLSRASVPSAPVFKLAWYYNNQLSLGTWPGAHVVYYPLVTANVQQNPVMSMLDANGNILIVTGFGTTGTVAPAAPANSNEGVTVTDGSVTWTVVAPTSQGFRVFPPPGASGPVYQIIPYFQLKAPAITTMAQLINPIPDDDAKFYLAGIEAYCLEASPNPGDAKRAMDRKAAWFKAMEDIKKKGDRETEGYALLPASSPVENTYGWLRNPQDPSEPY